MKDAALELKLFEMLKPLPLAGITSFIGIILVLVFFVTSSDSGSLVIDTITAGGKTDAPVAQRVFWCTFEGVVAATLLLVRAAPDPEGELILRDSWQYSRPASP